ncbi:nitroreductase family protein [Desulfovibrio cuneatus]|uniref:nitroreductase family protein n=1 Tax=Desulfovibrio cuneatus TaxID=159728 RepID=UPI0004866710|nr:nitroreductase family protein [Desulfovibrio cuneatus]
MEFLQLAKERHSVRKFHSKPVEMAKLQNILEAGRVAPTAANFQPQRFLVVSEPGGLSKLDKAGNMHGAPLAIVVCSLKDKSWQRPQDGHSMVDIDATIPTTHMMLQAWSEGVASCWITWFDPAVVRSEFSLPDNVIPVNILVLGYSDDKAQTPCRHQQQRIPLNEMVWKESLPCSLK